MLMSLMNYYDLVFDSSHVRHVLFFVYNPIEVIFIYTQLCLFPTHT